MRNNGMKFFCLLGVLCFLFTACHYDPAVDDQLLSEKWFD